jgi:hypothetical protein
MAEKPLGRVTFTADGRMMSVVSDGRSCRQESAGNTAAIAATTPYDGEKLVTRVDAASDPSRIGSNQVRGVRFEGARMVLIPRRAGSALLGACSSLVDVKALTRNFNHGKTPGLQ